MKEMLLKKLLVTTKDSHISLTMYIPSNCGKQRSKRDQYTDVEKNIGTLQLKKEKLTFLAHNYLKLTQVIVNNNLMKMNS